MNRPTLGTLHAIRLQSARALSQPGCVQIAILHRGTLCRNPGFRLEPKREVKVWSWTLSLVDACQVEKRKLSDMRNGVILTPFTAPRTP